MINSERNIFLKETEVKPNRAATLVMSFLFFGMLFCWVLNELGIFRVGKWEMRIGAGVPIVGMLVFFLVLLCNRKLYEKPGTKWAFFWVWSLLTLVINTLLNFHTTMMLLFPIFGAMLYRSKKLGVAAMISSIFCTAVTPILGYVLHTWDLPFLQELILIATGELPAVAEVPDAISLFSIKEILLYLVLPRTVLIASCAMLMFHVIKLGVDHVNNQILLDKLNCRDALTGLYNRNYYKRVLDSTENRGPVGLMFFDVNGLKDANDAYGHEYGDELLRRCAKSIKDVCTDDKTCGFRLGGDEFLIMIEGATKMSLAEKALEWSTAIERINMENKTENDGMVCSLAMGSILGDFSNLSELMREVDSLMYENKAAMKTKR